MDKRNLRSKEAVKRTLIRLSAKQPYPEITVQELCREAGVSRSAFYNNYHSTNDVIREISAEYMEKIRGRRLTQDFFEMLTENGDELKLLVETGVFGRDFSLYLKDTIAAELSSVPGSDSSDLSLNVRTLYHAFGIFGVLQSLARLYGTPYYGAVRAESIETLMDLVTHLSSE